jgi:hypothetical protein
MTTRFITFQEAAARFTGRSVTIVGSAPSCADNTPGFVDSSDVVVRVNNYKTGPAQGFRTDVHYSFYGTSIRKPREELQADGVTLCMCKCPDAKALESDWHERNNRQVGIDYRYIYANRRDWWFSDTFVPDCERYRAKFELLGRHIPTTGFAAILDVLEARPRSLYLTGFDFFESKLHNVDEPWRAGNPDDPICHRPDLECAWLYEQAREQTIMVDRVLGDALFKRARVVA